MVSKENLGAYFWRGGEKIDLDKSKQVFTAKVKNTAQLDQIRNMPNVQDVKKVQGNTYRLKVDGDNLDSLMDQFRSKEIGVVCHHAYQPQNVKNTRYYITEQIIVRFKPETPDSEIDKILEAESLNLIKKLPGKNPSYLLEVTTAANKNPIKVANSLAENNFVVYAEPNLINRFRSSHIPTDTHFKHQWHLKSSSGPQLSPNADVSVTDAWDITRGIRSVVVALTDDGFDLDHPDFSAPGKIVFPMDFADNDDSPFPGSEDYHGTPCAGVAVAEENGEGVVGAAPGCALMPVRFDIGGSTDAQVMEMFHQVGERADVISCSWGVPPVFAPLSQAMHETYRELAETGGPRRKGCVILFAAGNDNAPIYDPNNTSFDWMSRSGLQTTTGPILNGEAAHPTNLAIAAITSMNRKSAYSNWGKEIDVSAPSNNFHPINNQDLAGRGIVTTDNEAIGDGFTSNNRYTDRFGGTSSATPLAAGVAALVISANPNLSGLEVRNILKETADKIEDLNPDPVLGNQKGTYGGNGHSEWFGFGRVNAFRAVQKAKGLLPADEVNGQDLALNGKASGTLSNEGDEKFFKLTIEGNLSLSLKGANGQDFDLYVKRGSKPTTQDNDGVGFSPTSDEKVVINPATPGEYHIMVRSFRGAGDFEIEAELK